MEIVRIILTVIFILICVALSVLVLMQEGKSAGLGAISGAAETYWGKNKGRSMEGLLVVFLLGEGLLHERYDAFAAAALRAIREWEDLWPVCSGRERKRCWRFWKIPDMCL